MARIPGEAIERLKGGRHRCPGIVLSAVTCLRDPHAAPLDKGADLRYIQAATSITGLRELKCNAALYPRLDP